MIDLNTSEPVNKRAGQAARSYQTQGDVAMGSGFGSAMRAFDSALGGLGVAGGGIGQAAAGMGQAATNAAMINQNAAEATRAALGIGQDIENARRSAAEIRAQADKLDPLAALLQGYGGTMWDQGGDVATRGMGVMGQGDALMRLDPSAGGLVGKYVDYLSKLDPNAFVSRAASDTQNSYQNAMAQQEREMARRGVSAGSGVLAGLRSQLARALGTALSAAKTSAYQTGLDKYGQGLGAVASLANELMKTGGSVYGAGLEGQKAGEGAQTNAAAILSNIAALMEKSGDMSAKAGNLGATQAGALTEAGKQYSLASSTFNDAVKAYSSAVSGYNSAVGNVVSAGNMAANAGAAAAQYYAQVGQGFAQIAGSSGLFSPMTGGAAARASQREEAYIQALSSAGDRFASQRLRWLNNFDMPAYAVPASSKSNNT